MSNQLELLLSRLELVSKPGRSNYVARCPEHEDKTPSLSIRELDDGRILIHCFAGCATHSVLAAVGLSMKDLFPQALSNAKALQDWKCARYQDALALEKTVVEIYRSDREKKLSISSKDLERVRRALERISKIKRLLNND